MVGVILEQKVNRSGGVDWSTHSWAPTRSTVSFPLAPSFWGCHQTRDELGSPFASPCPQSFFFIIFLILFLNPAFQFHPLSFRFLKMSNGRLFGSWSVMGEELRREDRWDCFGLLKPVYKNVPSNFWSLLSVEHWNLGENYQSDITVINVTIMYHCCIESLMVHLHKCKIFCTFFLHCTSYSVTLTVF